MFTDNEGVDSLLVPKINAITFPSAGVQLPKLFPLPRQLQLPPFPPGVQGVDTLFGSPFACVSIGMGSASTLLTTKMQGFSQS